MIIKQLRNLKFLLLRLLRLNDSAHGIAIGFTVGALVHFVPTFGLGPVLSALGARLCKGNIVAGLLGGLVFLWVFPFLFYLNVIVGETIVSVHISHINHMHDIFHAGSTVTKVFFIGMIINIFVFGVVLYSIVFFFVKKYRVDLLMFIYRKWKI
ncbi:DUF2062 domain-containing protein [Bacillus sp. T3]|uniref:DUF2062 domain-containing protein n=1 Tax=Bacillus sp. T3 TaxID=467262 RepID=UPI002982449F|nr:DUF2062 domain-containing protein [Bacillus sp. T3]